MARATDYRTRWAGAYDRATGSAPFKLAPAIAANKARLDLQGTLDFIYAADTIGGNSGSPVIDRNANIIGANFDRNLPGLRNDYAYDLTMARSIAVSTAAIEQALKSLYPAPELLAELKGRSKPSPGLTRATCLSARRKKAAPLKAGVRSARYRASARHIVARDRQRAAVADVLHLEIARRPALEHDDRRRRDRIPTCGRSARRRSRRSRRAPPRSASSQWRSV